MLPISKMKMYTYLSPFFSSKTLSFVSVKFNKIFMCVSQSQNNKIFCYSVYMCILSKQCQGEWYRKNDAEIFSLGRKTC